MKTPRPSENRLRKLIKNGCLLTVSGLLLWACGHPLKQFYREIKKYGYIPYNSPLRESGPGTLLGGNPKELYLVASPQTCFPDQVDGNSTHLREMDYSALPSSHYQVRAEAEMFVKLFEFLKSGSPTISAGGKVKHIKSIDLEFNNVHVEYLNHLRLTEFYRNHMAELCKEYLDHVGFVIQAIKVGEMVFEFYNEEGVAFHLDLENIKDFIDIKVDVNVEIKEGTKLVIKTPKFVGYQLGRLRRVDDGMALYRASKTQFGKFKFEPISVFDDQAKQENDMALRVADAMAHIPPMDSEQVTADQFYLDLAKIGPVSIEVE